MGWRRYWIGRYLEAEPLLLRGLAMQERILGLGDPAPTAETAKRLAMRWCVPKRSKPRLLTVRSRPRRPRRSATWQTLALAGRADEAKAAARRCVQIYEVTAGPDNPSTVQAAHRLDVSRGGGAEDTSNTPTSRLQDHDGTLFDPFTQPWNDERRPDLIRLSRVAVRGG